MDNVCHTLIGAAMGEAGLKHRTRFGSAVLMLAANLPDLDVLVFATSVPPVGFRRGWTHGVAAQLLLPVALTGAAMLVSRWRRAGVDTPPLRPVWLLLLSLAGVLSHVFGDLLNNYGVRLLAPVDWRWFYGDAVFIIDPWILLALGAGIWLSRRTGATRPAQGALVFAVSYAVVMLLSAATARGIASDAWRMARGTEPRKVMAGPVAVTPFTRDVIVDAGDHYETGTLSWLTGGVTFDAAPVPKNDHLAVVKRASETAEIRAYLEWSRFPYWEVTETPREIRVTGRDMRFRGLGARLSVQAVLTK